MHTFESVHPKYTFEAVSVNYTIKAVGPLHAYTRIHAYMYTDINCNQYTHKVWLLTYQGEKKYRLKIIHTITL